MTRSVQRGHTFDAAGTLAPGLTVSALAATTSTAQGGVIEVLGTATNHGTVVLYGSATSSNATPNGGAASGTIGAAGVLSNTGVITLLDGVGGLVQQYGHGSALTIAGVLHNTGLVALQADAAAAGAGASLTIAATGTLQNDGTVSLSAEQSNSGLLLRPLPQILKDSGVLTNSGELLVGGGYTTVNSNYGVGAQVLITGVLLNTGSVFVGGRYQ